MKNNLIAVVETDKGTIRLKLFADHTPVTVSNFVNLARRGYYNNLKFHRVIPDFMIQGGGFDEQMQQRKTRFAIKNEAANGLKNVRGSVAMARTSVVDSATSQFFINTVDNGFLDYRGKRPEEFDYCVFGAVVEGMEVVDALRAVKTATKMGHGDVPVETVTIIKASVL